MYEQLPTKKKENITVRWPGGLWFPAVFHQLENWNQKSRLYLYQQLHKQTIEQKYIL